MRRYTCAQRPSPQRRAGNRMCSDSHRLRPSAARRCWAAARAEGIGKSYAALHHEHITPHCFLQAGYSTLCTCARIHNHASSRGAYGSRCERDRKPFPVPRRPRTKDDVGRDGEYRPRCERDRQPSPFAPAPEQQTTLPEMASTARAVSETGRPSPFAPAPQQESRF
jgi:hypothetical protein